MPNNDFALQQETIVNKERTIFESACNFYKVRYNISTLIAWVLIWKDLMFIYEAAI